MTENLQTAPPIFPYIEYIGVSKSRFIVVVQINNAIINKQ